MSQLTKNNNKNTKLVFFFLDFGSNYFIKNIDFNNKIIKLKADYKNIPINFNINTNFIYEFYTEDFKINIESTELSQDNIYKFYNEYFGKLIANSIYDKIKLINEYNNTTFNINNFLEESYPIGVFDNVKTKYICIINFNNHISKMLNILNKSYNTNYNNSLYLINISNSIIDNYSYSNKHNGYNINLMYAFWNSIRHNSKLIIQEYKIHKIKFNLGNLFFGLIHKFYNLYIIFESIDSSFEKQSYNFKSVFHSIKDKTKRAKYLNKMKNSSNNILNSRNKLKTTEKNTNINDINDIINELSNMCIIHSKSKKTKAIKYLNKDTKYDNTNNENRTKQIHTICKYITGSKHCYYKGYKDLIKDFEKFEIKQQHTNTNLSLAKYYDNDNKYDLFETDINMTPYE